MTAIARIARDPFCVTDKKTKNRHSEIPASEMASESLDVAIREMLKTNAHEPQNNKAVVNTGVRNGLCGNERFSFIAFRSYANQIFN